MGQAGRSARHAWSRVLAAAMLAFALTAVAARPARAVNASQILQVINQERAANGIPPVSLSPQLSTGNANHDNYERLNGSPSTGYDIRGEDPSKPGYTPSGAQAGRNSLLAFGDRSSSYVYANDDWTVWDVFDNAPNHLVELMDPAVRTIGADQLDFSQPPYGTIHISSVDVRSAPLRPSPSSVHLYSYIGPFGRAPTGVSYVEGPTANRFSGPWLYVWFLKPAGVKLGLRSIALQQPDGAPVPAITMASGAFSSAPGASADVRAVGGSGTPTTGLVPDAGLDPPSKPPPSKEKQDAKKAQKAAIELDFGRAEDFCSPILTGGEEDEQAQINADNCLAQMRASYDEMLVKVDPADPNFMAVPVPRTLVAPKLPGCVRIKNQSRRRCQQIRTLEQPYLSALAEKASLEQAISVTLNRLSTAGVAGNQFGVQLQEGSLYTLNGELATKLAAEAKAGSALAHALRRAGVHGQISAAKLARVRSALLSGNAHRFPKGAVAFLRAEGISASQFSRVLRQAGAPRPTRMKILAGFTDSASTAGLNALYERLGPSGVGAIVSSLASTGAISSAEHSRLAADVLAAQAATTSDQRQAAMGAFLSDLRPLPTGQLRTFLETAATGLTGSDGYTLVVTYTFNGRAQTARTPVLLG